MENTQQIPEIRPEQYASHNADQNHARHDREYHAFKNLTDPEQARYQVRALAHYSKNAWPFLRDCVYTLDQVDSTSPIKAYPAHLEYLEFLTAMWLRHKLIAVPKSRRMICSWNFISLYTWDTIFHSGRFNGFVSKKEDDAGELVSRAEFIFNNIPAWRIPQALRPKVRNGKMSKQPPVFEFEDLNSKIQGFPQGADQLRQFTLSGLLGDECAFWSEAQKFYSSSKPTIDGGGRMTLISSRSPGFFKKLVFDKMDAQDLTFRETPPSEVKKPLEGVEVWKNPQNKFIIIDLHYTANPAKRGAEWRESVRSAMPIRDFLMEYEKSWQTYEGKPVYEDYQKPIHCVPGVIEAEPGIPLLLGVDFGLTPCIIIAQLVGSQLRILEEHLGDSSIDKLASRVWKHLTVNYLPWIHDPDGIMTWIDPAGFQRVQTDAGTCAGILRSAGFTNLHAGPVPWEVRRKAVEDFLTRITSEGPGLLVSESGAPLLAEGFSGGYQYSERVIEIEPDRIRPLKNKFSHCHDALQYLAFGAGQTRHHHDQYDEPTPHYGFQKG